MKNLSLIILNDVIRKSRVLTKFLFQIKINNSTRIHWDFTTLILKRALNEICNKSLKVLEVGTGPYALLSAWLNKNKKTDCYASDINEVYVEAAKRNCIFNNCLVNIKTSDLFENINESYDLIFFNSVYIPDAIGGKLGIKKLHEYTTDWSGGENGTEIINKFISEASEYLRPDGQILLGFNPAYLECEKVNKIIENKYLIDKIYRKKFNPSICYLLRRAK